MSLLLAATASRGRPHVVVIGVNGMELDVIRPLLLKGAMPNPEHLINNTAAAGTAAMANYASLRGPMGLNRVYAEVPIGPLKIDAWLNAVKRGQTFATNGPLLGLKLNGKEVGDTLQLPAGNSEVKVTAWLRSFVRINHLELICNGKVARELKLNSDGQSADIEHIISGVCFGLRVISHVSIA